MSLSSPSSSDFDFYSSTSDYSNDYDVASSNSTPINPGAIGLTKGVRAVETATAVLREDIASYLVTDVPLEDFAHEIWGLDLDSITKILKMQWSLDADALAQYKKVLQKCSKIHERELYEPFRSISDKLVVAVATHLGIPSESIIDGWWDGKGDAKIPNGSGTWRQPDLLRLLVPIPVKASWRVTKVPLEFKKRVRKDKPLSLKVRERGGSKSAAAGKGTTSREAPSTNRGSSRGTTISESTSSASQGKVPTTGASTPPVPSTGSKRKSVDVGLDDIHSSISVKRKRLNSVTLDNAQLANYVLECFNATSRLYTTGIFIDKFAFSIWYYDRSRVLRTTCFEFNKEPEKLALSLYALSRSNRQQAGFSPFLRPWPSCTPSSEVTEEKNLQLLRPVETLEGSLFEFPDPNTRARETKGQVSSDTDAVAAEDPEQSASPAEPSPQAKASISCPQPPIPKAGDPDTTRRFHIIKAFPPASAIIGRATAVYAVQELLVSGKYRSQVLALKLSWPLAIRKQEGDIIRSLVKKLPAFKDHLPDMYLCDNYTMAELFLPLLNLSLDQQKFQSRHLHIIVGRWYRKLWEVGTIENFKRVWLDCVECHHAAWKHAKTLHRDLSENNLMVLWKKANENRDESQDAPIIALAKAQDNEAGLVVKGVLNDWDMASDLDNNDQVPLSGAHHRTGTIPFMAKDLLSDTPPRHKYRHDLESFFYILIWAAAHYDLRNKKRLPTPLELKPWTSHKLAEVRAHKGNTLLSFDGVYDVLRDEFAEVTKRWIGPLHKLFQSTYTTMPLKHEVDDTFDYETCNGLVTFDTFMKAIGETPRKWD